MMHNFIIVFLALFLSGCTTTQPPQSTTQNQIKVESPVTPAILSENKAADNAQSTIMEETSTIFGKTEFLGILKTSYVKLYFIDQAHPDRKFELHIGERMEQAIFPWQVMPVNPGYFFINLPVGQYHIYEIAIPVASTMAVENANIVFEVLPDQTVYVGTLKVKGTKERIKVGGVPLIKPGFRYVAHVIDEFEEGKRIYQKEFPQDDKPLTVRLMQSAPVRF